MKILVYNRLVLVKIINIIISRANQLKNWDAKSGI